MIRSARIAGIVLRASACWLVAGFAGLTLVWWAPGYGVTESDMDTSLSEEVRSRLRSEYSQPPSVRSFYASYMIKLARGDFGTSVSYGVPVRELLIQRAPRSARAIGYGLALAWFIALPMAALSVHHGAAGAVLPVFSAALLCIPVGLTAMIFFLAGWPVYALIAAGVYPRVFTYLANLLRDVLERPHVLAARARGVRPLRLALVHIAAPALPETLALAGISVTMATGVLIPAEVFSDSPGLGQLAWKSALARDVPLLVTITLLVTAVTLISNSLAAALTSSERSWRA